MLRELSKRNEFAGFLAAGAIAAGTNFGSRILFSRFASYPAAIVLAYLVGMITAFLLMRGHVFRASGSRLEREILIFIAVNLLAVLQTLLVSLALAYFVLPSIGVKQHVETLAHLVGVAVPIVTSYIGHKHWTFRAR